MTEKINPHSPASRDNDLNLKQLGGSNVQLPEAQEAKKQKGKKKNFFFFLFCLCFGVLILN
jgi:hypothetical protein